MAKKSDHKHRGLRKGRKGRISMSDEKYVVIVECVNGNASVGSMWLETKVFSQFNTLESVMDWARKKNGGKGKVILTIAEE